jgi:hypothetical protein
MLECHLSSLLISKIGKNYLHVLKTEKSQMLFLLAMSTASSYWNQYKLKNKISFSFQGGFLFILYTGTVNPWEFSLLIKIRNKNGSWPSRDY